MKKRVLFILILFLFPLQIFAYSNKVIIGGDSIGIELTSNGIYVVGFYPIQGILKAKEAGMKEGDRIISINQEKVTSLTSFNEIITKEGTYTFHVIRNNKELDVNLPITKENDIYKTGLYVKNRISGIGTLSYIDPETKIYGALGHEIIESSTLSKFELKDGEIYKADVSSIHKSKRGETGEKNATIDRETKYGNILINETSGIYGKYEEDLQDKEVKEISLKDEIKRGKASIRTVINNNKIEEYTIQIINIEENEDNKNIFFEITDKNLLQETGGIVQGMSGSPIIQNDKIIGVVNYVVVDNTATGYGIFIEKMLEEGDKLFS